MLKRSSIILSFTLLLLNSLGSNPQIQPVDASRDFHVGDWIQYEVTITPILTGEITPTSMNLKFIDIEDSIATVQTLIQLSDGNEITDVGPINIETGSNTGYVISPNTNVTDQIYIRGFGNLTIAVETTSVYTGVDRGTISAQYSNATHSLHIIWDKLTGIMLEQDITLYESTTYMKILDTNIWQTQSSPVLLYQIIIILVIASIGLLLVHHFRS